MDFDLVWSARADNDSRRSESQRGGLIRAVRIADICGNFVCISATPALADKRVALVIGMSKYQQVPRLANPARDADAMAALFRKAGFDLVESERDLGIADLRRVIREFSETSRDCRYRGGLLRRPRHRGRRHQLSWCPRMPGWRATSTSRTRPSRSIACSRRLSPSSGSSWSSSTPAATIRSPTR